MPDTEANAAADADIPAASAAAVAQETDGTIKAAAESESKAVETTAGSDADKKPNKDSNKISKSNVSAKGSQAKGATKPFDEVEVKSDDSKDSKTAPADRSSKKKVSQEEDDDSEEDEKPKNSQKKGSDSKSSAKEEKVNVAKKEKSSESSSKSKKRKEHSDEESDAKDKETGEEVEESEALKKKSRKKVEEEEEEEEDEDEEEEELKPGLLEQPVVLEEGLKREKKKVQRLELTSPTASKDKKLDIPEGSGEKLGDIPRIELHIGKTLSDDLRPLHRLLFHRAGLASELKRNIRRFSGFTFAKNSAEYKKKVDQLNKMTMAALKWMCEVLDLERSGRKEDILERILNFLMKPKSSGKALPKSKKRRSSAGEKSKSKQSKSSKKTSQKKNSKKSDSESEEKEETENEEEEKEEEEEEEEEEEQESEDESTKKKESKKTKKSTPAKKTAKTKSPKPEAKKPKSIAKTEKTKKNTSVSKKRLRDSESGESSDEEPLKRQKTEPTDDELKDVVKKILEGANLEEVTMKTVYKQVFEKYPDFDLSSRKEFIKAAVKQIIR